MTLQLPQYPVNLIEYGAPASTEVLNAPLIEIEEDLAYLKDEIEPLATNITVDQAGNVGIGTANPESNLSVAGTIESTSVGFKFPDGTIQSTAGGGLVSVQSFTDDDTWTKPVGVTKIIVQVVGGGTGGTDGYAPYGAGGGGAGGYVEGFIDVSFVTSVPVTVGAGGGASGSGGNSSFGTYSNATGGSPQGATDRCGGLGGTETGGYLNLAGGDGGSSDEEYTQGGHGGASFFGGGLGGTNSYSAGAARVYGAGGGGHKLNIPGGAGMSGIVIVKEYR